MMCFLSVTMNVIHGFPCRLYRGSEKRNLSSFAVLAIYIYILTSMDAVVNKPLVKTICINKTGSKCEYSQREVPLKYE